MSAFRGTRILAYFGHSLGYRPSHQRRIFSLGLTSLPQVTMGKPAYFSTNMLNVNKLDLSADGILSSNVSTSYSTDATGIDSSEVMEKVDGAERSMKQQDKGTSTACKWPAPVPVTKLHAHKYAYKFRNRVYVHAGKCSYVDNIILKDLLSRFGETMNVSTFKSHCGTYYYGYVSFASISGKENALKAERFEGPDGAIFKIEDTRRSEVEMVKKKEERRKKKWATHFIVKGLPDEMTINQLDDYFQSFGKLKLINLFISESSFSSDDRTDRNYAVISYRQVETEKVLQTAHYINNEIIHVEIPKRYNEVKAFKDRCQRVHLSGINLNTNKWQIEQYLSDFGGVQRVILFTDQPGHGLVIFNNKEDAMTVAKKCWHNVHTSTIKAQLLGVLYD